MTGGLREIPRFEYEIRFRYGNSNRDRGIKAQIRELMQRKGETFTAYVTEVETLNQRSFSSKTLFELIRENMRSLHCSTLSVLDIKDLYDLIEINHKIDANDPGFIGRTKATGMIFIISRWKVIARVMKINRYATVMKINRYAT